VPAALVDLVIEQNADFSRQLVWQDAAGAAVPFPNGTTAKLQIRKKASSSSTVLLELSTANNRITLHPTNGTITLTSPQADNLALAFDTAVYDLVITFASSAVRLLKGTVTLDDAVTR
jgi:hypothetical protein